MSIALAFYTWLRSNDIDPEKVSLVLQVGDIDTALRLRHTLCSELVTDTTVSLDDILPIRVNGIQIDVVNSER